MASGSYQDGAPSADIMSSYQDDVPSADIMSSYQDDAPSVDIMSSYQEDAPSVDIMSSPSSLLDDSEASITASVSSDVRRICAVCGDNASGKHYGVYRSEHWNLHFSVYFYVFMYLAACHIYYVI